MARLRRVTALFLALLLSELVLVGSGYACAMSDPGMNDGGRRSAAEATPAAAVAPVMGAGEDCPDTMPADAQRTDHSTPDGSPCPLPWALTGCRGVPCAPASLAPAAPPLMAAASMPADRPSLAALAPASVVRAPELPPPRA